MMVKLHQVFVGTFAALCVFAPASNAMACWCNRVYTSYYVDPCVSCPAPAVSSCPTTSCYTTSTQRCYLEPQVSYRYVTQLEPRTYYVRRAYYDPYTCCNRSYYTPATQYVARSYQIPTTSYVQRCCWEPQSACPTSTSQPASNGDSNGTRSTTPQPATRNEDGSLERPVYREDTPQKLEPKPPKPVPMPSPQSSSPNQALLQVKPRTLTTFERPAYPAVRLSAGSRRQVWTPPIDRRVGWP
jgi:hypothetical protein